MPANNTNLNNLQLILYYLIILLYYLYHISILYFIIINQTIDYIIIWGWEGASGNH